MFIAKAHDEKGVYIDLHGLKTKLTEELLQFTTFARNVIYVNAVI